MRGRPKKLTFGSLFAGIGGFDLGLERAGMKCLWQVEINSWSCQVLAKHWPKVHREKDVKKCGRSNLEKVDVICGGFPCQDISLAGYGEGISGARSGLWSEYARIVGELRPRYVLVENVSALLKRGMGTVLGDLSALGYDAEWHCIPASSFGAPHRRDRVWIVAYSKKLACNEPGNEQVVSKQGKGKFRRSGGDVFRGKCGEWWEVEPRVGRVAHGISDRVDRLKGLGNAVVPQIVEFIGRQIIEHARMNQCTPTNKTS